MIRLLVSVRDETEARQAAAAGAQLIDLKDPAAGALGGLAPERVRCVAAAVRACAPGLRVSATIGDFEATCVEEILRRVAIVADCGVDLVKVGIQAPAGAQGPRAAQALLAALAALAGCAAAVVPVVPVLLVDDGLRPELVAAALATGRFPALMLDTSQKGAGSLVARLGEAALAGFVEQVRRRGVAAGLAGALALEDVPALRRLEPDFAGFRSAVCAGGRTGVLEGARVQALRRQLAPGPGRMAPAAGAAGRGLVAGEARLPE